MMKPITKYATSIVSGNRIPYILSNAFKIAEQERPGAVAIELPEDVAAEHVDEYFCVRETQKIRRPQIDEKMLEILKQEASALDAEFIDPSQKKLAKDKQKSLELQRIMNVRKQTV